MSGEYNKRVNKMPIGALHRACDIVWLDACGRKSYFAKVAYWSVSSEVDS